jgi:DNA-binding NtrC family response regulator
MLHDPRILVADDEKATVWLWARILQWGFGAEVVAVFDGDAAIAQTASGRFDLVISDVQMPGATGLDVLRCARARDPQVPVILATGHASSHVVAEASRLGARILEKPFLLEDAVALVREVLHPIVDVPRGPRIPGYSTVPTGSRDEQGTGNG